ncbi:protein of unknown function DUF112 transmembrane [Caldalkalibacillus thermarum TA2.A1]|nr:protein of unknown function DUF112 transmembrane [Caldalkalibacillus thermarum TA2.A1]
MRKEKKSDWFLILSLVFLLSLTACGGNKPADSTPQNVEGNQSETAEDWKPEKPIEIVAPAGPGGGWDTTARTVAKQGQAGKALAIAAIASFCGGTFSIVALMLVAPIMADVATAFGPSEYFALMLLGLTAIASLSEGSMTKALIAAVLGLMVSTIGIDGQTGTPRFTFGSFQLMDGIDFLVIALGLFAIAEVCFLIMGRKQNLLGKASKIGSLKISKQEAKEISGPIARHSVLGSILGVLPGAGATIASFIINFREDPHFSTKCKWGMNRVQTYIPSMNWK